MPQATRPSFITCAQCGAEKNVGQRGPVPVYCSDACRAGNGHDKRIDILCAYCSQPASVRRGSVYCSPRCRNSRAHTAAREDGRYDRALLALREATQARRLANVTPCPYCKTPMMPPKIKHCGDINCKRRFNADRMRDWNRAYREENGGWYPRVKFPDRQGEYYRRRILKSGHWRQQFPELAATSDARRRALVVQARTAEMFAPLDVHTRDEWTCQLCMLPIDPSVAYPDSLSPSIDHVIPLSRGGLHAMANVQSAHLGCNSSKGDKLMSELIQDLQLKAIIE